MLVSDIVASAIPVRVLPRNALFVAVYLYTQLVLCPSHTLWFMLTGSQNAYAVTRSIASLLKVTFKHTPRSHPIHKDDARRTIYLCNHRSWADFFMDQAITGGAAYLSRMMVWLGTPMSSLYSWATHSTWFFHRRSGIDRSAFVRWMESSWVERPHFGMIAYPEGTRNLTNTPKKLKTGVLWFAFEFKHPVQIVITAHKEEIINERTLTAKSDVSVVTSYSEMVDPATFETREEFIESVRSTFEATWEDAYSCEVSDAIAYEPPQGTTPPVFESAPVPSRVWMLRGGALAIVAVTAALTW